MYLSYGNFSKIWSSVHPSYFFVLFVNDTIFFTTQFYQKFSKYAG